RTGTSSRCRSPRCGPTSWSSRSSAQRALASPRLASPLFSAAPRSELACPAMSSQRKLRVAVLFGGRSAEPEISPLSARLVVQALDRGRLEPILIGIDKTGRWLLQEEALLLSGVRDPRLARLNQSMPDVALAAHPGAGGEAQLTIGDRGPMNVDVV